MAAARGLWGNLSLPWQSLAKSKAEPITWQVWIRQKFTRARIPESRYEPRVHKNIPSVNEKLKVIKHLISIKPLKLPHGIPTEEEMSDTYINISTGELIIRRRLKPLEQKAIDSL
ncbi:hypothetical protein JD844_032281 [Phrynosoma platyrhinos]|uniref:39S ribosomal protein L30, mitochondrial n=1 Tax=Phrynosoma platyrhinos TaxID=52577 RepID=A0ABQ7T5T8_PHRPL|nr:hypothetical protein JD844_032281 [Phrynosoma platyrhinos]